MNKANNRPSLRRQLLLGTVIGLGLLVSGCGGGSSSSSSGANSDVVDLSKTASPLAPTGTIWKPHSEGTGALVVLTTVIPLSGEIGIYDRSGKLLDSPRVRRMWEGVKPSFYFSRHGNAYPKPCYLKLGENYYTVPNGGQRIN